MNIYDIISFLNVLVFSFITFIYFSSFGGFTNRYLYKLPQIGNQLEYCFLGIFSLSFLALFFNFFISLNIYLNSLIILIPLIYLFFLDKVLIFKICKYGFFISLVSFITILLDDVNRPDAGLYHLPYTSLLNENKIIIGIGYLNERFGIISILQYLSAINKNFVFSANGIFIPLVIIYSTILIFFLINLFNKKKKII